MHEITTYWTQSGCDTLWHIDLTLCPHCHWEYDTVAPDELPVYFNGNTYNTEIHDDPIYISIPDTCDSIIFYTLIVIPSWGDAPIDSVWIQAPNVITPNLETNNIFAVACSHHILKAEVSVYNRYGSRVARFDGLTGSWDGTHQGQPCQQGTYVYHIRYIDTKDNNWKVLDGTVTLIR
jgi:gliding motility-associated-like protein